MNEPAVLISPHYGPDKLEEPTTADLVDVFEDRYKYWLLAPAQQLADDPMGQVAAFSLALSYFEGAWMYISGEDSRGQSAEFFKAGFVNVFRRSSLSQRMLEKIAGVLFAEARCGFFHDGLFRHRIYFGDHHGGPLAVTLPKVDGVLDEEGRIESIVANPREFLRYIEGHLASFSSYIRLGSNEEAVDRFSRTCRRKWRMNSVPPTIVL